VRKRGHFDKSDLADRIPIRSLPESAFTITNPIGRPKPKLDECKARARGPGSGFIAIRRPVQSTFCSDSRLARFPFCNRRYFFRVRPVLSLPGLAEELKKVRKDLGIPKPS
jgi:hypothetical protein